MRRQAGENDGNQDALWEEISYDAGGDDAHLKMFDLVSDPDWHGWDWMTKSGVDERVAVLACYEHVTGKNYAYMARMVGNKDITDEAVDQAASLIVSGKAPFPEKCEAPFITKWLVLGPFDDKAHRFIAAEQTPNEANLSPKSGEELLGKKWVALAGESNGYVNMQKACGVVNNVGAYAYTTVTATRAGNAYLWFGSDDGAKVFINGEVALDQDVPHGADPEQYIVPVKLREGANTILVKINNGEADWGLYARLSDPQGKPILSTD